MGVLKLHWKHARVFVCCDRHQLSVDLEFIPCNKQGFTVILKCCYDRGKRVFATKKPSSWPSSCCHRTLTLQRFGITEERSSCTRKPSSEFVHRYILSAPRAYLIVSVDLCFQRRERSPKNVPDRAVFSGVLPKSQPKVIRQLAPSKLGLGKGSSNGLGTRVEPVRPLPQLGWPQLWVMPFLRDDPFRLTGFFMAQIEW